MQSLAARLEARVSHLSLTIGERHYLRPDGTRGCGVARQC